MSRAAVVYNPLTVSDLDELTRWVDSFMAEQGWESPLWLETTEADPGVGQCRRAVDAGCDVVFVSGGDGTVMAAVTALASGDVPLAILPTGTGNLLARNLDIPVDDGDACLRIGVSGRTRVIDVGVVEDRRFVVMAGLGFDAAMMRDAPEGLKQRVGWPAYVVSAVRHLRGSRAEVTLTIDGGAPIRRQVRTVLVGNVGRLQGDIPLLPDAEPDDGVLDVVIIAARGVLDWARVAGRVLRRTDGPDRRLERFTAKHVLIECSDEQARQLDGDLIASGRRMEIQVEPGALQIRVPHQQEQ